MSEGETQKPGRHPTPLIIVGAGGFGRETAAAVHAVNRLEQKWDLLGFADDDTSLVGLEREGTTVLGPVDDVVRDLAQARVVVCTVRPTNYFNRLAIVERLDLPPERYATIVHPAASIAEGTSVGRGTVILAGGVVTAHARIGNHVTLSAAAVVTHDAVIDDFATLGAGVRLGGSVKVGRGAYLGSGALIREDITIGAWSMVGMGAVVLHPVPPAEVWVGSPARRKSAVELPARLQDTSAYGAP